MFQFLVGVFFLFNQALIGFCRRVTKGVLVMLSKKLIFAAAFLLSLPFATVQAGGDPVRGEELSVDCADCHGEDGMGDEDSPKIAGLDEMEHFALLKGYQSGEIEDEDEDMVDWVEDLTDQDMADLAAYYATLDGG
jgi:sulfide dehydrogenase cytochrome subunit